MRQSYPVIFSSAALLMLLSACDQNGGMLPLDGQNFLSSLEGPKIPSMHENQLASAKSAEKNEDFAQASQIYQQILEKDPETNDVVQLLADSLRRSGEYDKAISVYDGIIAKDQANVAAKEGKALALMAKGDFETPTVLLEEVLKLDGKRWKSLNAMGILFVTRGLYPDSMKYFEEALKQSPSNIAIMNNLGLSQALDKQYDLAVDTLLKASTQSAIGSSGRKRIDLNLALVYASAGKLADSRKIAEQYLSGPSLKNNLGLYAHLAKDDALAKSYLNMALTESKTYYEKAWENLEALNSAENRSANKNEKSTVEKLPEDKTKPKKEKPAAAKDNSSKITVIQEPDATKSEVKSIGEIIAHEIKDEIKDEKIENKPAAAPALPNVNKIKSEESVPVTMPAAVKPESVTPPSVDNVIDNIAKSAEAKTVKATGGVAANSSAKNNDKSLGKLKTPATNLDQNKQDNSSQDGSAVEAPANNAEKK